ncbi:putative E3 ubiquitin-protein ligase XBAT35 isoform X2 [Malania oleifera]|uniref:putative E3 ubiquitin-protein ligase XBAT35 isoform X2 n=1 Tax=Malania oleifera TaxID=397392 RepID=UPI0025AE56FD|nr:putative E3 ubiquitin-protein ligase XBAT35 isoform X2 [Malania oleifera]XP_057957567.1 putative E3 ubiquitin-protein ligase XBAT35 isoform X2 [Malania oleifera]
MGQQQSKDELLYQQVNYGNSEGIKELRRQGAGLEWIDREGKTPLILACMNPELLNVAKTLIEIGANVNAYRPGRHAGTPLHHAAKRGLEHTVKLLLAHGANTLVMNDDCQTPLDVARAKGFTNVVRAIENHICLFSGWLREFHGPGFLEALAPQLVTRKVWVVVLPSGARNPTKPFKLELAIYPSMQVAQPRTVIALGRANMEEPKFDQPDPAVTILDNSTKMRIKLAPSNASDKQQLQWFCNACKGIPQGTPAFLHHTPTPVVPPTAPPTAEDLELAMAINASIQSAIEDAPPFCNIHPSSEANTSTGWSNDHVDITSHNGWGATAASAPPGSEWAAHKAGPSHNPTQPIQIQNSTSAVFQAHEISTSTSPSAPPIGNEVISDGPIHYPSIDDSPVEFSAPAIENLPAEAVEKKENGGGASSCVICLDAPVEGACIPCGHMAGCMSCLNEIKTKNWGCPVCRAKIDQIIRLYAV